MVSICGNATEKKTSCQWKAIYSQRIEENWYLDIRKSKLIQCSCPASPIGIPSTPLIILKGFHDLVSTFGLGRQSRMGDVQMKQVISREYLLGEMTLDTFSNTPDTLLANISNHLFLSRSTEHSLPTLNSSMTRILLQQLLPFNKNRTQIYFFGCSWVSLLLVNLESCLWI